MLRTFMDGKLHIFLIYTTRSAQITESEKNIYIYTYTASRSIVSFSPVIHVKIPIKRADWASVKLISRMEYKNDEEL